MGHGRLYKLHRTKPIRNLYNAFWIAFCKEYGENYKYETERWIAAGKRIGISHTNLNNYCRGSSIDRIILSDPETVSFDSFLALFKKANLEILISSKLEVPLLDSRELEVLNEVKNSNPKKLVDSYLKKFEDNGWVDYEMAVQTLFSYLDNGYLIKYKDFNKIGIEGRLKRIHTVRRNYMLDIPTALLIFRSLMKTKQHTKILEKLGFWVPYGSPSNRGLKIIPELARFGDEGDGYDAELFPYSRKDVMSFDSDGAEEDLKLIDQNGKIRGIPL